MGSLKNKSLVVIGGGIFRKFNIDIFLVMPSIERLAKIQEDLEADSLIKEVEIFIWVESTYMDHTQSLAIKPLFKRSKIEPKNLTLSIALP